MREKERERGARERGRRARHAGKGFLFSEAARRLPPHPPSRTWAVAAWADRATTPAARRRERDIGERGAWEARESGNRRVTERERER